MLNSFYGEGARTGTGQLIPLREFAERGLLNTPDNGVTELDVMAHHDQVAPPASHTTQVAGGESIVAHRAS